MVSLIPRNQELTQHDTRGFILVSWVLQVTLSPSQGGHLPRALSTVLTASENAVLTSILNIIGSTCHRVEAA